MVSEEDPSMEKAIIRAVTHEVDQAKVTISGVPDQPGVAANVFRTLADVDVNVDMIVQNVSDHGVTDISFTVPRGQIDAVTDSSAALVESIGAKDTSVDETIALVSLIGAGMKTNPGVAARMFETLADAGINLEMISTSPIRISCVVHESDAERSIQLLHAAFERHLAPEDRSA
jgi:aspartate kinase